MKYFNKIKPEILAALIIIGIVLAILLFITFPKYAILFIIAGLIYGLWDQIVISIKFDRRFK